MFTHAEIEIWHHALQLSRDAGYRPQFFFRAYHDESLLVSTYEGPYLIVETFPNPSVRHATDEEYDKFMQ